MTRFDAIRILDLIKVRTFSKIRSAMLRLRGCKTGLKSVIGSGVILVGRSEYISLGNNVTVEDGVKLTVSNLSTKQPSLQIGNGTFIGRYSVITAREHVFIGDKVLIAPFCYITDTNHGISSGICIHDQPSTWKNVTIHDGVWLGNGCTILPGVTIGVGAVIAANSVVNKNIPANAIAGGSPARILKYREDIIEA